MDASNLSSNQSRILAAIRANPRITMAELRRSLDFKHPQAVKYHVEQLQLKGYIKKLNEVRWEVCGE